MSPKAWLKWPLPAPKNRGTYGPHATRSNILDAPRSLPRSQFCALLVLATNVSPCRHRASCIVPTCKPPMSLGLRQVGPSNRRLLPDWTSPLPLGDAERHRFLGRALGERGHNWLPPLSALANHVSPSSSPWMLPQGKVEKAFLRRGNAEPRWGAERGQTDWGGTRSTAP